jgi:hypothetical protein
MRSSELLGLGGKMASAKLVHPVLFSKHFKVPPTALNAAGLLDPILNSDTKLFIDPLLIFKSKNPIIKACGRKNIKAGFTSVIDLLDISVAEKDAAWKGAYNALNLDERSETGLGYGGASTSGSSRPPKLRHQILRTTKEIITLGVKNPDVIPLMGLFEEGVGPDTLSDMTTNYILTCLAEITEQFCKANKVTTTAFGGKFGGRELPANPYNPAKPVILVPRDILRDLPLAADWSDVSRVVLEVREIRDSINKLFGNFAKASVTQKKAAVRKIVLSSKKLLTLLINAVTAAAENYDEKADLDGYFKFREILSEDPKRFRGMVSAPSSATPASLTKTVLEMIDEFKKLIENNNMWELLWYGSTPRHERASQLLFFAVSTMICATNNIDISPETNSGGGPVDFKFSKGFKGRVLVELKLSKGRVVHGYQTQLDIYKKAAATQAGVFVVLDVGGMGNKLRTIQKLKAAAEARGEVASEIVVINEKRRKSASKR